jgi:hypothetical protein
MISGDAHFSFVQQKTFWNMLITSEMQTICIFLAGFNLFALSIESPAITGLQIANVIFQTLAVLFYLATLGISYALKFRLVLNNIDDSKILYNTFKKTDQNITFIPSKDRTNQLTWLAFIFFIGGFISQLGSLCNLYTMRLSIDIINDDRLYSYSTRVIIFIILVALTAIVLILIIVSILSSIYMIIKSKDTIFYHPCSLDAINISKHNTYVGGHSLSTYHNIINNN